MKKVISENKIPIKLWTDNIEENALVQANNIANLPFAFRHVAIMPDVHTGYGVPIGGVFAAKKVIVPNAVGKDIGCGMIAVKTNIKDIDESTIKLIMSDIRSFIPVGLNQNHSEPQDESLMPDVSIVANIKDSIVEREYNKACRAVSTLGSGNHFHELQKDEEGYLWVMIHSGSRNLGSRVADYYDKIAKKLNEKWFSGVPKRSDLAFLPIDSEEGNAYLQEMKYCLEFAQANRDEMLRRTLIIIGSYFDLENDLDIVNIHHNYAAWENHFGENVIVHRKGATRARLGEIGIIPGSQGTCSYIVKGLGNKESFESCSHGAGRTMSRSKARTTLNLEEEVKKMNDLGIVHGIRNQNDLDEASSAYKDIEEVIDNELDLIEPIVKLRPIAVIKG